MRISLSQQRQLLQQQQNAGRLNTCEAASEERDNGHALGEDVGLILQCRFGAARPIYTFCDLSL